MNNFINIKILIPLGISFFTFSCVSFLVDAYKTKKEVELLDFMLYILYFPKLIQGPLMNYDSFIEQINNQDNKNINYDNLKKGLIIFVLGLSKKVLLADVFGKAANWGFSNIGSLDSINALIVIMSYTFQIYFDFSGYSNMAYGISNMMNIDIPINFNYPYLATSIADFWKRWHISLTNFFTKYIYIPLGGNRKGVFRTYVNTLIVFFISGLWHGNGLNYIFWGILNGLLLVLYKCTANKYEKINIHIKRIITFILISILWTLFRSDSIASFIEIIRKLFSFSFNGINDNLRVCFDFTELEYVPQTLPLLCALKTSRYYILVYMAIGMFLSLFGSRIQDKMIRKNKVSFVLIFLFIYSILSLTSVSTFIYEGF